MNLPHVMHMSAINTKKNAINEMKYMTVKALMLMMITKIAE